MDSSDSYIHSFKRVGTGTHKDRDAQRTWATTTVTAGKQHSVRRAAYQALTLMVEFLKKEKREKHFPELRTYYMNCPPAQLPDPTANEVDTSAAHQVFDEIPQRAKSRYHENLLYCSLLPGDYEFEKDMLVHLWMAVGLSKEEPLESSAGSCFEDLISLGYIQHSRTDLLAGKPLFKFDRDCVNIDLLSGNSHVLVDSNDRDSNLLDDLPLGISHLSVKCCSQIDLVALGGFKRFKQLKTLLFLEGHKSSFKHVPRDLFFPLEHLQALDFSRTLMSELPNSIGNMKCLHYLDLSHTAIRRLPETIDQLKNLQTLKLKGCSNFYMLPKGMRKLVNLRHLVLDVLRQLHSLPKGMGTLTNLQTLSAFLVGREDRCGIEELKNMNNLSGSFCISRIENVLTEEEAMKACLCNKSQLQKLELRWSVSRDEDDVDDGKILSSLQPSASLEELQIVCYGGFELPTWICNPAFSKLVSITLFKCEHCLVLPSLGQLPSLKVLNIVDFHKLKVIDHNSNRVVGIQGHITFPKLEKLTLENMYSLEEWTGIGNSDFPCLLRLTLKHCSKLHSVCTLSCLCSLKSLEISQCTVLASCADGNLPASLETLILEDCPLISAKFLKNECQDWFNIAHIPNVWVDHQEISKFPQV